MCSLTLSVLLAAIGVTSLWFVLNWQGDNAPPYRRAMITSGGMAFCWETAANWSYFGHPKMVLGRDLTINGQRVRTQFDWYFGPMDVPLGLHPLRLTAGNVQVSFFALALVAAAPAIIQSVRRRLRLEPWQCPKCRYDLRQTPTELPCPECGTARQAPIAK